MLRGMHDTHTGKTMTTDFIAWSHSRRKDWMECPRMFYHKNVAPKGSADRVEFVQTEAMLAGNRIDLVIDSDRFVRAHDALLRLRRPLSELLGKQFRIGVRGLDVNKFEIEVESERGIEHKIPYVREIRFEGGRLYLSLDVGKSGTLGQAEIENRIPDRIISLLEDKLQKSYGGKTEHWELLWESAQREPKFTRDPTEEMQKTN